MFQQKDEKERTHRLFQTLNFVPSLCGSYINRKYVWRERGGMSRAGGIHRKDECFKRLRSIVYAFKQTKGRHGQLILRQRVGANIAYISFALNHRKI